MSEGRGGTHMPGAALVYTPRFNDYDLGPSHPLKPARVLRTYELIRACGLLEGSDISLVQPSAAGEEVLALVHSQEYIEAVRAPVEGRPLRNPLKFGLGTVDNPIVDGMYEATAIVVGASVAAADAVVDEKVSVAFNPSGGLHHGHRARAAGFCIFNDVAVAIAHVLQRCGEGVKVAYVDIDAHHGDGVQEAFYDRRDVLTISVHESGRYLFPGTGGVDEIGEGEGEGFSVNVPLSPHTNDEVYVWAFREAVAPLLEAFEPDFLVTQLGVDTHYQDPLTHMCLTTRGYMSVVEELAQRAGRWIAVGGGGYDVTVVPRAWTLAFARMVGEEPPEHMPESEAGHYRRDDKPAPLHDAGGPTVDEDWARVAREFAEQSVAEVKARVFPFHGFSSAVS
ncbi:MAG: acetoin utilization protein AcuC [Armatimonadota bacterium]|nr:MAG: acetoin utilization protein AcuC [Armatimonadota bacterium]